MVSTSSFKWYDAATEPTRVNGCISHLNTTSISARFKLVSYSSLADMASHNRVPSSPATRLPIHRRGRWSLSGSRLFCSTLLCRPLEFPMSPSNIYQITMFYFGMISTSLNSTSIP